MHSDSQLLQHRTWALNAQVLSLEFGCENEQDGPLAGSSMGLYLGQQGSVLFCIPLSLYMCKILNTFLLLENT